MTGFLEDSLSGRSLARPTQERPLGTQMVASESTRHRPPKDHRLGTPLTVFLAPGKATIGCLRGRHRNLPQPSRGLLHSSPTPYGVIIGGGSIQSLCTSARVVLQSEPTKKRPSPPPGAKQATPSQDPATLCSYHDKPRQFNIGAMIGKLSRLRRHKNNTLALDLSQQVENPYILLFHKILYYIQIK